MLIKKQKIKINLSRYLVCVIAVILCVCTLPMPSAKAARALFSDDFENGLVNWEYKNRSITDASFSEAKEQQNTVAKLEISEKTSGFHRFLTMGTIENFDDASIEFDVKDITGGRGAEFITIFLRANDDLSQYYAILINYAGTISLAKNIYTASNIPGCSVKASAGGYNLSVWNHFRIDTVGNKIDVYINNSGTPVLSYTDTDSPNLSGSIGFMVRSGQRENNIVHFDNVVVNPVAEKTETSGGGIGIARDLKDNELAKKAMLLANLNIMNYDSDDNFLRDKVVTRGEFAEVLGKIYGIDNIIYSNIPYDDIEAEDSRAAVLYMLKEMGIIGKDHRVFLPDNPINYKDAVNALIKLLGYQDMVEKRGLDISIVAFNIGLTKGIVMKNDYALTRGNLAELIFNALNVPLMEYSADGKHKSNNGNTLLSEIFNVYELNGVLQADEYNNILNSQPLTKGYVQIGNQLVLKGNVECSDALGYYLETYYVKERDSESQLLCVFEGSKRNKTVEFTSDDVISFKNSTYIYEEEGKEKKLSLPARGVTIIYNGKVLTGNPDGYLLPGTGTIKAIDNGSGNWNILYIYSYTTTIVDAVDRDRSIVYDISSSENDIDFSAEGKDRLYVIKDSEGWDISVRKIAQGDVLSVAKSLDGKIIKVIQSRKNIYGTVKGVNKEGKEVLIDEVTYEISPSYHNAAKEVALGVEAKFKLDIFGKIVGIDGENGAYKFGYLLYVEKTDGLTPVVSAKLFSVAQNGFIALNFNKNVTIDGHVIKGSDEVFAKIRELLPSDGVLIKYSINSDAKIVVIDFPEPQTSSGVQDDNNSLHSISGDISSLYYSKDAKAFCSTAAGEFGSKFLMNEDTVILMIPNSDAKNEDGYTIASENSFRNENLYNVSGYTAQIGDYNADIVLWKHDGVSYWYEKQPIVVDEISTIIDENGEETKKIYGYNRNGKAEVSVSANLADGDKRILNSLSRGDMLFYSVNAKGEVTQLYSIYDLETDTMGDNIYMQQTSQNYEWLIRKRNVATQGDGYIGIVDGVPTDDSAVSVISLKTPVIIRVGVDGGRITVEHDVPSTQIKSYEKYGDDYSMVIVQLQKSTPRLVVIYDK